MLLDHACNSADDAVVQHHRQLGIFLEDAAEQLAVQPEQLGVGLGAAPMSAAWLSAISASSPSIAPARHAAITMRSPSRSR